MKLFSIFALSSISSVAAQGGIVLDPDEAGYEAKLFAYLQSFGPTVMDDPYFMQTLRRNNTIGVRGRAPTHQDFDLRMMKQLKTLVVAVMNPKIIEQGLKDGTIVQGGTGFGRYCFYGCHCLPDHEHASKSVPFGKPKDGIDETCRQMGVCYKCLENKYKGKCKPEKNSYKFEIKKDRKGIDCLDKEGTCKRDICECDKAFALNVKRFEMDWDVKLHSVKGDFDRKRECRRSGPGRGGGHQNIGCCGEIPNVSIQKDNEQCCGPVSFNPKRKECCNRRGDVLGKGQC